MRVAECKFLDSRNLSSHLIVSTLTPALLEELGEVRTPGGLSGVYLRNPALGHV